MKIELAASRGRLSTNSRDHLHLEGLAESKMLLQKAPPLSVVVLCFLHFAWIYFANEMETPLYPV